VESYRNSLGRVCHRTLLTIGFFDREPSPEQLNAIARALTDRYQKKTSPNTASPENQKQALQKLKSVVHDLSRFIGKPEVKNSLPVIYKAYTPI